MSLYQLYACDICASSRTFGAGACEPANPFPILNCSSCGKPTPHHYVTLITRRITDEKFWKLTDNAYDPTGRALSETERGKSNYERTVNRHRVDKPKQHPLLARAKAAFARLGETRKNKSDIQ